MSNKASVKGDSNFIIQGSNNQIIFDSEYNTDIIDEYKNVKRIIVRSKNPVDHLLLYYPYFELENKKMTPKFDHELYLKSLLLISETILLPPSHLLDSNPFNLNMINRKFRYFIETGSIITSYRKGQSSVDEFIKSKIDGKELGFNEKLSANIVRDMFADFRMTSRRDVKKQSAMFYSFLRTGIFSDDENSLKNSPIFKTETIDILDQRIHNIIDSKGFKISKKDLDSLVLKMASKNELTALQAKMVMDFSNSSYFYGGGIGNNSLVGYSNYFLKSPVSGFLMDGDNGTNLFYDPEFFIELLISLEMISSSTDIKSMSTNDIIKIRDSEVFKRFVVEYRKFSRVCYQFANSEFALKKSLDIAVLNRFKVELKTMATAKVTLLESLKSIILFSTVPYPFNLIAAIPIFLILSNSNKIPKSINPMNTFLNNASNRVFPLASYTKFIRDIVK